MPRLTDKAHAINGATKFPRVQRLRQLFGDDVLMLSWPLGTKGLPRKWGHLTAAKMGEWKYLEKLESGNIGIAQGEVSGGVCSIDLDSDEWASDFLSVNPRLVGSLRTKGKRGCNVWVRCRGEYPASRKLKANGKDIGEWRANGNQTIVSGMHPEGCEYAFLVEAKPVEIAFDEIIWPEGMSERGQTTIAHSALSAPSSLMLSQSSQVGCGACLFDVECFVPSQRGQSDRLLFAMAGRLKSVEMEMQRPATNAEKTATFKRWWALAESHVDPDLDSVAYLSKWLANCKKRKRPDNETALSAAWKAAQTNDLPAEAVVNYGLPISSAMKLLIALCYELQRVRGSEPFFLASRDAGKLLNTPFRTVAFWLDAISAEDGEFQILKKVSSGSQAARRANEYLYPTAIVSTSKRND